MLPAVVRVILLWLLTLAPAGATQPLVAGWMVILSGSTDRAEAEAQLARYQAEGLPGTPQLVESATVEGLQPGFYVVVLAVSADEPVAREMAAAWQSARPGTYVREVRVPIAEAFVCDGPAADPRCAPPGWRVLIVFDATDGMQLEEWPAFPDQVLSRAHGKGVLTRPFPPDWTVPVEVGDEEVAKVDITPFVGELFGYVFAMQGKEPVYQAHAPPDVVWSAAAAYYGLPAD